jgi:hypothetical protein
LLFEIVAQIFQEKEWFVLTSSFRLTWRLHTDKEPYTPHDYLKDLLEMYAEQPTLSDSKQPAPAEYIVSVNNLKTQALNIKGFAI